MIIASIISRRISLSSSFLVHPIIIARKQSGSYFKNSHISHSLGATSVDERHHRLHHHTCLYLKSNAYHDTIQLNSSWTHITSKKNPIVKLFQSLLKKKKAREEHNLTVIEGYRLVIDLLQTKRHVFPNILVTEDALAHDEFGEILQHLLEEENDNSKICVVSNDVLQACTDTVSPQGIVATIKIASLDSSNLNRDKMPQNNNNNLILIMDGLSDPGNVGTLIRTSSAIGTKTISTIIMLHDTVDIYMPKVIRSSMGAIFSISNIMHCSSFDNLQNVLNDCNVHTIYAATMMDDDSSSNSNNIKSIPYWEMNCNTDGDDGNIALCIGNEASGLSYEVRDKIKEGLVLPIHIPMSSNSIESLNAAVSGSIIMYEFYRQISTMK